MQKVVVSVDGSEPSRAAVAWCATHLDPRIAVIAACGVSALGEFALGLPPFESSVEPIRRCLDTRWCEPLRAGGRHVETRLLHRRQVSALLAIVDAEDPDLLIIGRQRHHGLGDLAIGKGFDRLIHRPPCPLLVVAASSVGSNDGDAGAWAPLRKAVVDVTSPGAAALAREWCEANVAKGGTVVVATRLHASRRAPSPADAKGGAGEPAGWTGLAAAGLRCERQDMPTADPGALARLVALEQPDVLLVDQLAHKPSDVLVGRTARVSRLIDRLSCAIVVLPAGPHDEASGRAEPGLGTSGTSLDGRSLPAA